MRKEYFEIRTQGPKSKRGNWRSILIGKVFFEPEVEEAKYKLAMRAAALKCSSERAFYLAEAALIHHQWNEAWKICEGIYKEDPEDVQMDKSIVDLYKECHYRDMELCIWLTRFLKLAPDWNSFISAYSERTQIEQRNTKPDEENEKAPDMAWHLEHRPLKVYYGASQCRSPDQGRIFAACEEAFNEWIIASGCKFDVEKVQSADMADVVCAVEKPELPYDKFAGQKLAPKELPRLARLGLSQTSFEDGQRIAKFHFSSTSTKMPPMNSICV